MARSRNIKPGFFTNDELVELPFEVRLLFIGLWTIADREGRLSDRPKKIRMEIFPADNVDCDAALEMLSNSGFISRYSVNGERFIQVQNWHKHQSPHLKEAQSTIPEQTEHHTSTVQAPDKHESSTEDAALIPDSLNLIPDSLQNPAPEKPARFDPLKISLPDCINPEAWAEWIAYRRDRKLTTRQQTMQAQVAELETWAKSGHDPTSVIRTSIAKGWQGLFEPKQGNQNGNYSDFVAELTGRKRTDHALVIDGQAERVG